MKKYYKIILVLLVSLFAISPSCSAERPIDKVYYTNGDVFSETNLFSDRNNGFYNTYHHNRQMATTTVYQDGKEILNRAFDEEGKPIIRNGTFKTYYADGTVASAGKYRNDLKNGEFKYYFYDGVTVVDVWHYWNGTKVGEHVRNDQNGKFVSSEDLGYPSQYVQELEGTILVLGGVVALFFLCFVFYKDEQSC